MLNNSDQNRLQLLMKTNPEANELIQKLMDDQQFTISTISHELRNPLTIIHGTMQILEAEHPEISTFDLWPRLCADVNQMRRLLEDLSSYNNRNHLTITNFSMEDFLYDLADSFYYSIEDHSAIIFESEIDEDWPEFSGDKNKLHETILNLLVNAKDSLNGTGTITLSAEYKEEKLYISVQDTGCGIPEKHIKNIFEPFITYKKQGTGLGLAISKSIIEAHNGTLSVTSTSDLGTTFLIALPVVQFPEA